MVGVAWGYVLGNLRTCNIRCSIGLPKKQDETFHYYNTIVERVTSYIHPSSLHDWSMLCRKLRSSLPAPPQSLNNSLMGIWALSGVSCEENVEVMRFENSFDQARSSWLVCSHKLWTLNSLNFEIPCSNWKIESMLLPKKPCPWFWALWWTEN